MKSLIFGVDGEVVLAYVSGANQLDEAKLAAAAGGAKCSRVDADAVRAATGFPIGGVPPFGHTTELRVFIDPDLLQYDEIWAAAGTWTDVFALTPTQLVERAAGWSSSLARDELADSARSASSDAYPFDCGSPTSMVAFDGGERARTSTIPDSNAG